MHMLCFLLKCLLVTSRSVFPVSCLVLTRTFPSSEPFICSSKQLLRNLKSLKSDDSSDDHSGSVISGSISGSGTGSAVAKSSKSGSGGSSGSGSGTGSGSGSGSGTGSGSGSDSGTGSGSGSDSDVSITGSSTILPLFSLNYFFDGRISFFSSALLYYQSLRLVCQVIEECQIFQEWQWFWERQRI